MALGYLGAYLGVRSFDLVVDGLADVMEEAAHLGGLDVGAELGGNDRGQPAGLHGVDEHVLTVAGAELEPPQELDYLRWQGRDAGVVDSLLPCLAHYEIDFGAGLGHDFLDAARVDAAICHELGEGQAGHFPADRVEGADDDRFRRVVDDQVHASSLFEGADVAAFATDDASLHLVVGQMDGGDGVLGGVVGGDALHRRDDDLASSLVGLFPSLALYRLGQTDGVALRLVADGLEQMGLGLGGGHAADTLESGNVLLLGTGQFLPTLLELALAIEQLPIALLEHVGPHVELFVAGQQPALERGQLGAFGAGLVLGLALEMELLVLRGEDQLLLLGSGLGHDPSGLLVRALKCLVGHDAAGEEPDTDAHEGGHDDSGHKGDGIHMNLPPTRSDDATGCT